VNLLLHAITPLEAADTPLAGLRGQPLVRVEEQGLAAWATEFRETPDQLTRADLLSHHDLVTCLHEQLDAALPARFPTWVADVEGVRHILRSRRAELATSLDRVRGRAELSVTVVWLTDDDPPAAPDAATPGRRYLLERRQALAGSDRRRERARELADRLERLVGPDDLIEGQRQVCPSKTIAVSIALLVPRVRAAEVKGRLARVEPDVRILVNGPWPPYSFVDIG
jgi:hypothetical protein